MWTRQEKAVLRHWVQGTKETQALDETANERIDGNHAFSFELAEGDMNGPLIGASST